MLMDTLEFLERVLPTEGHYCAIVINSGAPQQAFFGSVGELATRCQQLDAAGNNTYYALSTFNTRFKRTQDNVHSTRALFLDIDCAPEKAVEKKGYASQQDGLQALQEFLIVTGMPMPMIVSSGRGLHVYWTLTEPLTPMGWQPLADALKSTFQMNGFLFDPAVTADSARVLRPVGTHNPKNGRQVKVLKDAGPFTVQELQNILPAAIPTGVPQSGTVVPQHLQHALGAVSSIGDAMGKTNSYAPASHTAIYTKCAQVAWAVDNQAKVSEPLWYKLLGIAAYCENPQDVAKQWSSKHPNYSEAETTKKVTQWAAQTTGPTTCAKLQEERPKGCANCPLKGTISSPIRCGTRYEEAAPIDPKDLPAGVDPDLPMPFKMFLSKTGTICQLIDGTDIEICPFDVRPVSYGKDHHLGYEVVRYKWKRPHVGWQDLVFRQAYLNDENREFATTIADQGIVLAGKKQTEGFRFMLRGYMDELRKKRSMSSLYGSMGWKEGNTQFVLGERLYKRKPDGTVSTEVISLSSATGNVGAKLYTHAGTVEDWARVPALLESHGMWWHLFAINTAFSSVLWNYTGLNGLTISLHGDTGGGKSIAQLISQSVWGDPKQLHFSSRATHNAIFARLSTYGNLPMTIDEATHMERVGEFCFDVTQGRDKARLSRSAIEREIKEWATNVMVSTNISWASKLAAGGNESDAQFVRLLEYDIPVHPLFHESSDGGKVIVEYLRENHGVVGGVYAEALVGLGEDEIRRRLKRGYEEFNDIYKLKFAGSERFWQAELVAQHVGCGIATEAGAISYDYGRGIKYITDRIYGMRQVIEDNRSTAFDYIKRYLNEIAADVLTVMHTKGGNPTPDPQRLPRGEIKARFDVYRDDVVDKFDKGTVMIERTRFREWLSAHGYDYGKLCTEVVFHGADATPSGKRVVLSKHTSLKAGQQYVVGINLCNVHMMGFLDEIQGTTESLTLGQLGVVTPTGALEI